MENNEKQKQQPIFTLRDRGLSAGTFISPYGFSINIQKSWKKKDEEGYNRETLHLFEDDLLRLAELLRQTYILCCDNRDMIFKEKNKENNQPKDQLNDEVPF